MSVTKIRNWLVIVVVAVVAAVALGFDIPPWDDGKDWPDRRGPAVKDGGRTGLPELVYEGTWILFPDKAPDAATYNKARRDPKKAVVLIRWKLDRELAIDWYVSGKVDRHLDRVYPWSDRPGITTFSEILDVESGDVVGIEGDPQPYEQWRKDRARQNRQTLPDPEVGWSECMIFHKSQVIDRAETEHGAVACSRNIP